MLWGSEWVNQQPIAEVLTCLGDGHDGIWNIVEQLAPNGQRREVLDWFHLMENLHSCGWVYQALAPGRNFSLERTGGRGKTL